MKNEEIRICCSFRERSLSPPESLMPELRLQASLGALLDSLNNFSRHPTVLWAQRPDKLFITVELPDAKNVKVNLEPEGKFFFSATTGADNTPYEVELDLFDKVDVNESKIRTTSRSICYLVKKAESKWWDIPLKQGGKLPIFLKVDWNKWVDEYELEEKADILASEVDFGDFRLTDIKLCKETVFDEVNLSTLNKVVGKVLNVSAGGDFDADIADN